MIEMDIFHFLVWDFERTTGFVVTEMGARGIKGRRDLWEAHRADFVKWLNGRLGESGGSFVRVGDSILGEMRSILIQGADNWVQMTALMKEDD
jgi:hypothetical protein